MQSNLWIRTLENKDTLIFWTLCDCSKVCKISWRAPITFGQSQIYGFYILTLMHTLYLIEDHHLLMISFYCVADGINATFSLCTLVCLNKSWRLLNVHARHYCSCCTSVSDTVVPVSWVLLITCYIYYRTYLARKRIALIKMKSQILSISTLPFVFVCNSMTRYVCTC